MSPLLLRDGLQKPPVIGQNNLRPAIPPAQRSGLKLPQERARGLAAVAFDEHEPPGSPSCARVGRLGGEP